MFALAPARCYNAPRFGAWRSLVARFNGVEEVVGSNPAAPTKVYVTPRFGSRRFLYKLRLRIVSYPIVWGSMRVGR